MTEGVEELPVSAAFVAAKRRRLHQVLILLLGLVTLTVYSNSFRCGFALDNHPLIVEDPRIRAVTRPNFNLILSQDYWFRITSGLYRPVTTLSYLFNYAVLGNGTNPAGYHAVNLALAWLNAALVYLLASQIFGEIGLAFGIAALWSVHPLLTESITNIVGRADLLAGAAILGGLLIYIRAIQNPDRQARIGSILSLGMVAAAGIFAKENVAVLPAVMALYDFSFRPKIERRWRVYAYIAAIAPLLACWWVRLRILPPHTHPFVDNPVGGVDFWTAKLTAVKVIGNYLWLLLFPVHLSPDYSYNQIPVVRWSFQNWQDARVIVAAGACLLLIWIGIICYGRFRPLFFFMAFPAIAFLPTSNLLLPIGSIMAERFMYLPAIGFSVCVVVSMTLAGRRLHWPWLAPSAIALLCILYGGRSFARNSDWRDAETLLSSAVAVSPESFKTHMGLAMTKLNQGPGEIDGAIAEMERSLKVLSTLPDSKNVAIAYSRAGRLYREKGELLDSITPGSGSAWYPKAKDILIHGVAIDRIRNEQYRNDRLRSGMAAARIPLIGTAEVYLQLGAVYLHLEEPRRALEALQYGQKLALDNPEFYGLISNAYYALGDYRQQAIALLEGATILPAERRFSALLPAVYKRMDTRGCEAVSLDQGTGTVHVNLSCPVVHEQVCAARENVTRLLIDAKLESRALQIAQQAVADVRCPVEQFGFAILHVVK